MEEIATRKKEPIEMTMISLLKFAERIFKMANMNMC